MQRLLFLLLTAIAYYAVPNARPDLTRFNADDSEAYVALSYALTHGLGYTRSLVDGIYIPHTTWPPGMPALLAPVLFGTHLPVDWLAIKLFIILIGLGGIVICWFYVRRVSQSPAAADLAALLLALAPFYWLFSRMALTEVPTIAFVFLALLIVDLVWAGRRPPTWQIALAGLFCGVGMLLRSTIAGLIFVPLAYAAGPRRAELPTPRKYFLWALHAAAFCVPFLLWRERNRTIDTHVLGPDGVDQLRMLLTSDPTNQKSPLMTLPQFAHHLVDNAVHRIIYHIPEQTLPWLWNLQWQGWPGAVFLAAGLTLVIGIAAIPRRWNTAPLFFVTATNALIVLVFSWGGSIRFWIPITSLLIVLVVIGIAPIWSGLRQTTRYACIGILALAYGSSLLIFAREFMLHPYLGDFGDVIALLERVKSLPQAPVATYAEHFALVELETGDASPIGSAAMGPVPRYTNLLTRDRPTEYARAFAIPPGAKEMFRAGEWSYYALPHPMTADELRK
ncbi:MAG TPA: glycosyltransferase family 39 protein [Rhizomicrobium sp.]